MDWISVKDRLPKKDGKYLCVCKGFIGGYEYIEVLSYSKNLYKVDEYDFASFKGKRGFYSYNSEWGYINKNNVTHWMPLPELPKGMSDNDL